MKVQILLETLSPLPFKLLTSNCRMTESQKQKSDKNKIKENLINLITSCLN